MTLPSLRLPRGLQYDPYAHAAALGIQVIERKLLNSHELWMPQFNTIVIKAGMRTCYQRCALAHGIGHSALGHTGDSAREERQADRYASVYLISPVEFDAVISWASDMAQVAQELGVTHRLLSAYLSQLIY